MDPFYQIKTKLDTETISYKSEITKSPVRPRSGLKILSKLEQHNNLNILKKKSDNNVLAYRSNNLPCLLDDNHDNLSTLNIVNNRFSSKSTNQADNNFNNFNMINNQAIKAEVISVTSNKRPSQTFVINNTYNIVVNKASDENLEQVFKSNKMKTIKSEMDDKSISSLPSIKSNDVSRNSKNSKNSKILQSKINLQQSNGANNNKRITENIQSSINPLTSINNSISKDKKNNTETLFKRDLKVKKKSSCFLFNCFS